MSISGFGRLALLSCAAAALLAGCGGAQPPIGAPGAMPQSRAMETHRQTTSDGSLLYVSSDRLDIVFVYSYPDGVLQNELTEDVSGTMGLCSDSGGDVFVANSEKANIAEFAHGASSPKEILTEEEAPQGCAVDPSTESLAVANEGTSGIAIFPAGSTEPTYYHVPGISSAFFCGYDASGDLFVDGTREGSSSGFGIAELRSGETSFRAIKLSHKIHRPGAVQWDGEYITVADAGANQATIYRLRLSGSKASVVGAVHVKGAHRLGQSLILGSNVVVPFAPHKDLVLRVGLIGTSPRWGVRSNCLSKARNESHSTELH